MRDDGDSVREIRINPIVPTEPVLVATARGMRPKKAERDARAVVEICPRTSIPTGFELGSGLFVSTVITERAAEELRTAEIGDG